MTFFIMLKIIKLVFVIILLSAVLAFVWYNYQTIMPVSGQTNKINFEIKSGQGVHQISQNLSGLGLIRSQFYFETYVWQKNLGSRFIAGWHELSPSMNIKEIVAKLTRPGGSEIIITIIEGWNDKEIAVYLSNQGLFSQDLFLSEVGIDLSAYVSRYDFLTDKPANVDLEGFLFPDTYRIFKNSTAHDIVIKMLDNFDKKLTSEMRQEIKRQNRSVFQIITLASIIEKEVRNPEDMKKVADIFYKRLEKGIALQSDATVNYITGKGHIQPSREDTQIDNPYNTYKYPGLTPGPISNPGLNAINAAIYPETNPYYYFLTTKEGEVIYSKTYDEHLRNKAKYLN